MLEIILGGIGILVLFLFTVYGLPKLGWRVRGRRFISAREKMNFCMENGLPTLPIRKLEKRKYLTLEGLKNWDELTEEDKFFLDIE